MRLDLLRPIGTVPAMKRLALVLVLGCSNKPGDASPSATSSTSSTSTSTSTSTSAWTIDVKACERNVIKRRTYDGGADSLTIVGPDQDVCVVHVKHTIGREWTEADCKISRSPDSVSITSTAMDRMPGTCTLVESGTDTMR